MSVSANLALCFVTAGVDGTGGFISQHCSLAPFVEIIGIDHATASLALQIGTLCYPVPVAASTWTGVHPREDLTLRAVDERGYLAHSCEVSLR